MNGDDDKVVSYHDVLLRRADVATLQDGCWINDQIIAFFFEVLRCHQHATAHIGLMPGASTYLLLNTPPSDLPAIADMLQLPGKQCVLMALNDNPDVAHANGGSHWSLAVLHGNHLLHVDSHGTANAHVAARLLRSLQVAMPHRNVRLVEAACAQQRNGYDCGMHVLANAETVFNALVSESSTHTSLLDALRDHKPDPLAMRHRLEELIQNLSSSSKPSL